MKLYEVCSLIYKGEGNVEVDLRITSPGVERFYGLSGVLGRVSDIPAFLGGYECNCFPDQNSEETKYIITL